MIDVANPAVLVQGITGREASFWTERMITSGTQLVAGVTPGKGGAVQCGVPVYDSVEAACREHRIDASVLFVPPLAVKAAATDALDCGIGSLVILAEHVPVQDAMEICAVAKARRARLIGPNSPGVVVPGRWGIGIMPAWLVTMFRPGAVGVASRSGSLGALACVNLVAAGLGQSAFVGLGGDPVVGTTFLDALEMFESDGATEAIVMIGELGGVMEERAAEYVKQMTKPVIALIAGTSAPEGRRMGHAGAIMSGGTGSATSKIEALRCAGARIARLPSDIPRLIAPSASL
jgi:succinyl-CoA synthetase alpha subunit